jgi:hypothetical protein
MTPTLLSFYCDDTNPYDAPPEALKIVLDFASSEGIAGEASAILAYNWITRGLLTRQMDGSQDAYLAQLRRAYDCGIDAHFELMTHAGRFDFARGLIPEGIQHEGVWMYEPGVSLAEYQDYFTGILEEGERVGVRFTGVTWPGCSCDACNRRYAELHAAGIYEPNPNVYQALLNLAQAGKFRGRAIPCFFGGAVEGCEHRLRIADGVNAVYDLPPNAEDRFGTWLNDPRYVDADYYITANGQSGRIVELVRANAPYCLFYAHWQGFNPANGVGWQAFTQVVRRMQRNLPNQVVWMRPSELAARLYLQQSSV